MTSVRYYAWLVIVTLIKVLLLCITLCNTTTYFRSQGVMLHDCFLHNAILHCIALHWIVLSHTPYAISCPAMPCDAIELRLYIDMVVPNHSEVWSGLSFSFHRPISLRTESLEARLPTKSRVMQVIFCFWCNFCKFEELVPRNLREEEPSSFNA